MFIMITLVADSSSSFATCLENFSVETGCKVVILTIYDGSIFQISFSQHAGGVYKY